MTEKEKKRLEMYEQRYAESWKKREINEEGTLKPFSKEELEHIFMLNDHLKSSLLPLSTKRFGYRYISSTK